LLREIQGAYNFVEWANESLLFAVPESREEIELINANTGALEKSMKIPGPPITVIDTNKNGKVVLARGVQIHCFFNRGREKN
jgi:hypothetical protein